VGKDQGIVEDIRTKLQWMRCSLGQTWTGATCAGEATKYKWDKAMQDAPAGWRLPTKDELASLVYCSSGEPAYWKKTASEGVSEGCEGDYGKPTIWSAAFPNTPADGFWSSSPNAYHASNAWFVYFGNGWVSSDYKGYALYVRLVRGAAEPSVPGTPPVASSTAPTATPAPAAPSTARDPAGSNAASPPGAASASAGSASSNERYRFEGKDQGIVEDIRTKLQWQRCSLGQTWNGANCTGEATKYEWDEAQRIAPAGWRLPTKEELASLVYCSSGKPAYWNKTASEMCDGDYGEPTIWSAAFPNTPDDWFWSSSPYAYYPY
jgi:uncharacterized protein (TIGR02145 family)